MMTTTANGLQPGIHEGVPIEQYIADGAISKSDLFSFSKSPAKWLRERGQPSKDTPATIMGSAVDCAITEPDEFPLRYIAVDPKEVAPNAKKPRATKAWKEFVERVTSEMGRVLLTTDEYNQCLALRDAVRQHPEAKKLLDGARSQLTLVWEREAPQATSPEQSYLCKSRPDLVTSNKVVNLKTAYSADYWRFNRVAQSKGYYFDCAWALEACERTGLSSGLGYAWLVVDKETLEVAIYEASRNMLGYSRSLVEQAWPGIIDAIDHGVVKPRYPKAMKIDPAYTSDDDGQDRGDGWKMKE